MSKYSATQAEQIRKIASYLSQERVKQGFTVEDIASLTFIRLPMLKALEAGDIEQLPELIYVQGFIRRYGEALKLDGHGLSHQITASEAEKPAISPNLVAPPVIESSLGQEDPPTMVNTSQTKSVAVASQPRTLVHPSEDTPEVSRGSWFKGLQLYWLYFFVLGGAIAGLFYLFSRPPAREETAQTQGTQTVTKTAKTQESREADVTPPATQPEVAASPTRTITTPETIIASEEPSPILETTANTAQTRETTTASEVPTNTTPTPETSPETPVTANNQGSSDNGINAALQLEGDSWLQVTVDGKVEYEGILEEGSQQSWDAQDNLMIRAGNAGVVKLSVNNKPPEILGELGEVKTVEVTPDS